MNVLYVSYDGMTDALGRSQVIPYLSGLAAKGHTVHVISCEKKSVSEHERHEVAGIFQSHSIGWSPLSFSTRPPWVSKFIDVLKIKQKAFALHREKNFDIVHCRSYIAALAGLELKLKKGIKFVFDMRGFWANERIEGDMWSMSNPFYRYIYRFFKKKEKEFFLHADAVISLTHNGKEVIRELFGSQIAEKTTVIPCCVDTHLFSQDNIREVELTNLRNSLGIGEEDFVLSYLGSIGTWYMTDEMLMFFKKLKEKYTNARFLFISGDDPQFIKTRAEKAGLNSHDIVVAKASRNEVPLYLALSKLSIYFIRPVFSKIASSPTKQAEIMSMGIPTVCNAGIGDTDAIIGKEEAGLLLKGFSDSDFEVAVNDLDRLLTRDPQRIRQSAIKHFSLNDGVNKYDAIYRQL